MCVWVCVWVCISIIDIMMLVGFCCSRVEVEQWYSVRQGELETIRRKDVLCKFQRSPASFFIR